MKLIPDPSESSKKKRGSTRALVLFGIILLASGSVGAALFALPPLLAVTIENAEARKSAMEPLVFPVTVNPQKKLIVENAQVNALLSSPNSPFQASAASAGNVLANVFEKFAVALGDSSFYQAVASPDARFVTIDPGMRKEQVAAAFGSALGWSAGGQKQFEAPLPGATLPLAEGSFAPGVYLVTPGTTPLEAQALVNQQFGKDVIAHYGTTTEQVVPFDEAITIASIIEREAGSGSDMRIISGIIWNRLFDNMDLQIDATLQYAKASRTTSGSWWPTVVPNDKYIKSAYNTYLHPGLPPTPIATPSVAAVLAALNPVETSCLFYFHDPNGVLHCSDTYDEHVALLKQYYGQGK